MALFGEADPTLTLHLPTTLLPALLSPLNGEMEILDARVQPQVGPCHIFQESSDLQQALVRDTGGGYPGVQGLLGGQISSSYNLAWYNPSLVLERTFGGED